MTKEVEHTKRVDVEKLNDTARRHLTREEEERVHKWTMEFIKVVFGKDEEKEMDEESKELFTVMLGGDDDKILEELETYVFRIEYMFATNGGEPDLKDVLAVKLFEKLKGHKYYPSIIYQDAYLEHVFGKEKG